MMLPPDVGHGPGSRDRAWRIGAVFETRQVHLVTKRHFVMAAQMDLRPIAIWLVTRPWAGSNELVAHGVVLLASFTSLPDISIDLFRAQPDMLRGVTG